MTSMPEREEPQPQRVSDREAFADLDISMVRASLWLCQAWYGPDEAQQVTISQHVENLRTALALLVEKQCCTGDGGNETANHP